MDQEIRDMLLRTYFVPASDSKLVSQQEADALVLAIEAFLRDAANLYNSGVKHVFYHGVGSVFATSLFPNGVG
jgi:hypothetical protein